MRGREGGREGGVKGRKRKETQIQSEESEGKKERNEARLDSQQLAAVLQTIWVTSVTVFL